MSAFRDLRWSSARSFTRLMSSFIVPLILARLLAPSDFGVFAMAIVFAGVGQFLIEFGAGDAVIRKKTIDDRLLSSIFFLNIALGIIICVILILSANWIAQFFDEPIVELLITVLSINIVIQSGSLVPISLLRKFRNFKKLALSEGLSQVASSIIAIALAL
ncbi:oligosaccharide flippase family protein, partial [Alphaproteobacteria bacterium]|nr:oligosaccharide flippase family protein [Alphaproteobacteria bacterium]